MLTEISTGASNQIQAFTAANAFKTAQNALNTEKRVEDNTPSGVDLQDNNILLKDQNVAEIRDFAKIAGEDNLSNDDIMQIARHDKKSYENGIKFILLSQIGCAFIDKTVTDDEYGLALNNVRK